VCLWEKVDINDIIYIIKKFDKSILKKII